MATKQPLTPQALKVGQVYQTEILRLDHQGAGIAQLNGKTVFIEQALPSETVRFKCTLDKKRFARGELLEILTPSPERSVPLCEFYQECGGCQLQHMPIDMQRDIKQRSVQDLLQKVAKIAPPELVTCLAGEPWAYRRRARLSVKMTGARLELGFKQRSSHQLVSITHCPVLEKTLSNLIAPLHQLLKRLSDAARIEAVDLIMADTGPIVLLQLQKTLSQPSRALCRDWAAQYACRFAWQLAKQEPMYIDEQVASPYISVTVPTGPNASSIKMPFALGDFIQNNRQMNQMMVDKALDLLEIKQDNVALDLFCGMGNFSLPMALFGAKVTAVEGNASLIDKAKQNLSENHCYTVDFAFANLFDEVCKQAPWWHAYDKVLLDPPRDGAKWLCEQMRQLNPERIVYVSCDPASLARDAAILVEQGYRLTQLVVVDMFPQTYHIESIALFVKC